MSGGNNKNNDYYGYHSNENVKLAELRASGRHTRENLTTYGDETVGSEYFQNYQETYHPGSNEPSGLGSGVEAIYQRVMAQQPNKVQDLIDHWTTVATTLGTVIEEIKRQSDRVAQSWVSPGATQFLAFGPGAAMKSVYDWQLAAHNTATSLQVLLTALQAQQTKVQSLYDQYQAEVASYQARFLNPKTGKPGISGAQDLKNSPAGLEQIYVHNLTAIHEHYTYQAQVIESGLSAAYWDSYQGVVSSTPGIYEGPTNAVVAAPALLQGTGTLPRQVPTGPSAVVAPGVSRRTATRPSAPAAPTLVPPAVTAAPPISPTAPGAGTKPGLIAPGAPVAPVVHPVGPGTIGAGGLLGGLVGGVVAPGMPLGASGSAANLPSGRPASRLSQQETPGLQRALGRGGVLRPGASGGSPEFPEMPGRGGTAGGPASPRRRTRGRQSEPTSPVLRGGGSDQFDLPSMPGAGGRPGAPADPRRNRSARSGFDPTTIGPDGLPVVPFAGQRPAAPSVLGERTHRVLPSGSPDARVDLPPPPGATRSVLGPSPQGQSTQGQSPQGQSTAGSGSRSARPGPRGELDNPLQLGPLTVPANPVLERPVSAPPVSGLDAGVPGALRGVARPDAGEHDGWADPALQPDLALRHHGAHAAAAGEDRLDAEVFHPATPGGAVLAQPAEKPYEPEEPIALPGAG